MRNLCMKVSYDGTDYSGFQTQPRDRTVQDEIERVIRELTGECVKIISSGRTDAGVHAQSQIFNFLTSSPMELRRWCLAMNNLLPRDIVVLNAQEVPLDFHARKEAKRKTYHYTINNYRFIDVFQRNFQYHHPTYLNIEEMNKGIACLTGKHDFTSFCSVKSMKDSHVRTIYEARIEVEKPEHRFDPGCVLRIVISGNGFLYHMVRIIAGTLIYIGEGKLNSSDMQRILLSKDRTQAGPTAMAHGLNLWAVDFDQLEF
jgi:tRNA pseudouridine38-40 synthase